MKKGDTGTRMQFTAKLLLAAVASKIYADMGDLNGHKRTLQREGDPVLLAEPGYHRRIGSLTSEVGDEYDFELRELFGPVQELAVLGTRGADNTQALVAAPSGTASFTVVNQGRTYFLGKYNVSTVVVTVSAATKVEGTDYTIDLGSGALYIIPGGGIADAANVSVTFGCALTVFENYTTLDKSGAQFFDVALYEYDQYESAKIPRRLTTFTGQVWIDGGLEHTGKKAVMPKLKILATTKPVVKMLV